MVVVAWWIDSLLLWAVGRLLMLSHRLESWGPLRVYQTAMSEEETWPQRPRLKGRA